MNGGRISTVTDDSGRKQIRQLVETAKLFIGEGHVISIRIRKVGKGAGEMHVRALRKGLQHVLHFRLRTAANAAHACIHLQMDAGRLAKLHGCSFCPANHLCIAHGQRQVKGNPLHGRGFRCGTQHKDRCRNACLPQSFAFFCNGHCQMIRTAHQGGLCYLCHAVTISVGFYNRQ